MTMFDRDEDPQVREPILQDVSRESSHIQGSLEPVVEESNNNNLGQNMVMGLSYIGI